MYGTATSPGELTVAPHATLLRCCRSHTACSPREPSTGCPCALYVAATRRPVHSVGATCAHGLEVGRCRYLWLPQENADIRLTQLGYDAGAVSEDRYQHYQKRRDRVAVALQVCGGRVLR